MDGKQAQHGSDGPGPITFGVEWEFLMDPSYGPFGDLREVQAVEAEPAWKAAYSMAPSSGGRHPALRHVAVFLRSHGVAALTSYERDQLRVDPAFARNLERSLGGERVSFAPELPERLRFARFFFVSSDSSVRDVDAADAPEDDAWISVEISTPVLSLELDKCFVQMERAFGLVNEAFRTKVNPTCGLHVVSLLSLSLSPCLYLLEFYC